MAIFGYNDDSSINLAQAGVVAYIFLVAFTPGSLAKTKADHIVNSLNTMYHDISPQGYGWWLIDVFEIISRRIHYNGESGLYPPIITEPVDPTRISVLTTTNSGAVLTDESGHGITLGRTAYIDTQVLTVDGAVLTTEDGRLLVRYIV